MNYVTCRFYGRLGNQLWQIAATIDYGIRHGLKIGFPDRSVNEKEWPLHFKNLPRATERPKEWNQPRDGGYYDIPVQRNGITLNGFFQSWKYISHPSTIPKMKEFIGYEERPRRGIALHVRRGDYLQHSRAFPPLPMRYYDLALEHALMIAGEKTPIYIFSDDPKWCRQEFTEVGIVMATTTPVHDLFAMSQFEHQIIANSSFSMWAAMLNSNPYKTVFAPAHEQYYGPGNAHLSTVDLYPKYFTEIVF